MNDHKEPTLPKRQIRVTDSQTGETKMVDAPSTRPRRFQTADETTVPEPAVVASPDTESKAVNSYIETKPDTSKRPADKGVERDDKGKRKKIESCDEYLELFFAGKVKSLGEEIIHGIGSNISVSIEKRAQLIDDAIKSDFTLDKVRQLLVFSLNGGSYSGLAKSLREFSKDVVCRHPVMATQDVEGWFPHSGNADSWNIKSIWDGFVSQAATPLGDDVEDEERRDKKTTPADIQRARRNAFLCANIWRYAEKQTHFPELLRSLRSTFFQSSAESRDLERHVLSYLVSVQEKDRSGVADFARWFFDQTIHVQNQAEHYRQRLDSLQNQKREVDDVLAIKEQEIDALNQQLSALRAQLLATEEEVRVLKVHSKDDLERQASRTLRALEDEIPVLTDCLTALNRDPPKVEVAKEYLGTALDTLNNELKILREK